MLPSTPRAPMSSSSACVVVAVEPEVLAALLSPAVVLTLSTGLTGLRPQKSCAVSDWARLAAKERVIVPPAGNELTPWADRMRVRTGLFGPEATPILSALTP